VHDTQAIRTLFERHNLRCTRQREVLYEALAATKSHPTADELFQSVKAKDESLSLATVYNTLEAFSEVGLVRRIPCSVGSGACRFDADTSDHVHLATPDGRVQDVPFDLSRALLSSIPAAAVADLERRMGVRVSGLNVQVTARPDHPALS
jgi:Fur family transcriptional regulator, peroxide stress response regulator